MNNKERIQARIERDKARRKQKKLEKNLIYGDLNKIITMQNFMNNLPKCQKNVMWKNKPQMFCHKPISNIYNLTEYIIKHKTTPNFQYVPPMIYYERGKKRIITPIQFPDRLVQRTICDESMLPLIKNSLIYHNGASLKGKGTDWTRKQVDKLLRQALKEYGNNFYVLTFDFKSFFDNITHKICLNVLNNYYTDPQMVNLIMSIVTSYQKLEIKQTIQDPIEREKALNKLNNLEGKGICLGSQISQILAITIPNGLDHFIKDVCGMKYYIRYMDDGQVYSNDKNILLELQEKIRDFCKKFGIILHDKKTQIIKISKGFTFLKIKYRIIGQKIIKTLHRSGIIRMRRKLKKFKRLVQQGLMNLDDVYNSISSWLGHARIAKSYKTVKNMLKIYDKLFDGYRITNKFRNIVKAQGGYYNEVLQSDKWTKFRWNWHNLKLA